MIRLRLLASLFGACLLILGALFFVRAEYVVGLSIVSDLDVSLVDKKSKLIGLLLWAAGMLAVAPWLNGRHRARVWIAFWLGAAAGLCAGAWWRNLF